MCALPGQEGRGAWVCPHAIRHADRLAKTLWRFRSLSRRSPYASSPSSVRPRALLSAFSLPPVRPRALLSASGLPSVRPRAPLSASSLPPVRPRALLSASRSPSCTRMAHCFAQKENPVPAEYSAGTGSEIPAVPPGLVHMYPLNAYQHTPAFGYGVPPPSHILGRAGLRQACLGGACGRAVRRDFFSVCPQESIQQYVTRRDLTARGSLWRQG